MARTKHTAHRQRSAALQKRHWFTCDGNTLDWEASWYTEPFYTASRSAYDSAASLGPVNPPESILSSIAQCAQQTTTSSSGNGVAQQRTPASTVVATTTALAATTTSILTITGASVETLATVATATMSPAPTTYTTTLLSSSSLSVSNATALPAALAATTDVHAGSWDSQAYGVIFAAGLAIVAGGALWALWSVLRRRFPAVYAPREWFVQPPSRLSSTTSLASFFTSFINIPSLTSPTSEANLALFLSNTIFVMARNATILGVITILPIIIAGVPHLSDTAPSNGHGGRLGSLTDLSILRLLNALDPSPESPAVTAMLNLRRNLPSTIAPALASARPRLIAVLVVTVTLWVGMGLFVVSDVYRRLVKYGDTFNAACDDQDMVFVPSKGSPWCGMTETGIRRRLLKVLRPEDDCTVAGVFVASQLDTLREISREREHVLNVLETAETKYILSFPPLPPGSTAFNAPAGVSPFNSLKSPQSPTPNFNTMSATTISSMGYHATDFSPAGPRGSAFVEVAQRHSVVDRDGHLQIGQTVMQDDDGTFLPVTPAPAATSGGTSTAPGSRRASLVPSVAVTDRASNRLSAQTGTTTAPLLSRPSSMLVPAVAKLKADVTWSRARLLKLNAKMEEAQRERLQCSTRGDETAVGWVIVGRGVRTLPGAIPIRGRSKHDVIWGNLGSTGSERQFWVKVGAVGAALAAVTIPFVGLSMAGAPGFANYLGFLKPMARSDGLPAGIVEGFVPAVALTLFYSVGVVLVRHFASRVRPVSYSDQRALAFKAVFYLLLAVGTIWFVTVGALEYATAAFATNVEQARAVGDGAVFLSWLSFIVLTNLAIIVPGLTVLQPIRLLKYLLQSRKAITPRQKFRVTYPPDFDPSLALAPLLIAFFHLSALAVVFPLLAVPVFILAYLTSTAHGWLTSRVFCLSRGGMSDGSLAAWTLRRLGWVVTLQPCVFGLVLLSRDEWILGGVAFGLSFVGIAVSELLTVGIHRPRARPAFPLADFSRMPGATAAAEEDEPTSEEKPKHISTRFTHGRLGSDHSLLATLHALLPSLSRLQSDNPLPLGTEAIDDLVATHRAMDASPEAAREANVFRSSEEGGEGGGLSKTTRGLIYAPELLARAPDVWLPRDAAGVARREVDSLAGEGLAGVLHPTTTAA